jgi:guanylate kinase
MDKQDFIEWVKKIEPNYRANEHVALQLSKIDLIALVGPTGVGKTTIIEKLGLPYVLSDVTREKREGEKDGHEYFFRNDYFQILDDIKAGLYAQFLVSHGGDFYGTRISSYPSQGPAVMAIVATAIPTFRQLGFRKVVPIYILPPGYTEWMRRIGTGRAQDFTARMKEAAESLPTALADSNYKFVLNDDLNLAVKEVQTIIQGGAISEHRESLARSSADLLFGRLGVEDDLLSL